MGSLMAPLVLLFVFFSCSNQRQEIFYTDFEKVDSLEVILPLDYIQVTRWTTFADGESTFLIEYGIESKGDLLIHRIDFDKEIYLEPIRIPREGPHGFNSSDASIYYHSKDSIFVFPAAQDRFFLYNFQSEKINEFEYNSPQFVSYYRSGFYSNAVIFDKDIAIPTVSEVRYDDQNYFEKEIPVHLFSLEKETLIEKLRFPDFVKGSFLPSEYSGPTLAKIDSGRMLVNYRFSDSLYIFNSLDKSIEGIYCGLRGSATPPLLSQYPSRGQELDFKIKELDYETVFARNESIFRIVSHLKKDEYRDLSGFEILEKNLRGVTLIQLDLMSKEQYFYEMPIAKYFVFDENSLTVGGVSSREKNGDIYRKFYRYYF